jgi:hypothetical protein
MTQFVDQCRSEWKRLNVPEAVANEMAAELEADLHDAEADGLSPEAVLGNGVFDPRSFAAAWASERGVVPPATVTPHRDRRTLVSVVIGAFAIAALAAGLAILSTHHAESRVALAAPFKFRPATVPPGPFPLRPREVIPRLFITPVRARPGDDSHSAGWILLSVGLAGMAASLIVWRRWLPLRPA